MLIHRFTTQATYDQSSFRCTQGTPITTDQVMRHCVEYCMPHIVKCHTIILFIKFRILGKDVIG